MSATKELKLKETNINTLKDFILTNKVAVYNTKSGNLTHKHIYRLYKKYLDFNSKDQDKDLVKWYLNLLYLKIRDKQLKPNPFSKLHEEKHLSLALLRIKKDLPDLYLELQQSKPDWMLR